MWEPIFLVVILKSEDVNYNNSNFLIPLNNNFSYFSLKNLAGLSENITLEKRQLNNAVPTSTEQSYIVTPEFLTENLTMYPSPESTYIPDDLPNFLNYTEINFVNYSSTILPLPKFPSSTLPPLQTSGHMPKVAPTIEVAKKNNCAMFKNGANFNYDDMADVWQTLYYILPQRLPCFKIHIRKVTTETKVANAAKYGNFSDTIDWQHCNLEIRSSSVTRKHYLQGSPNSFGILDNIIISEENGTKLYQESADQWRVHKNLLLMRDCSSGDLVIFSRVPHRHSQEEIDEALLLFGEEPTNGTLACDDDESFLRYFRQSQELEEEEGNILGNYLFIK